jgi:hypothetical protein
MTAAGRQVLAGLGVGAMAAVGTRAVQGICRCAGVRSPDIRNGHGVLLAWCRARRTFRRDAPARSGTSATGLEVFSSIQFSPDQLKTETETPQAASDLPVFGDFGRNCRFRRPADSSTGASVSCLLEGLSIGCWRSLVNCEAARSAHCDAAGQFRRTRHRTNASKTDSAPSFTTVYCTHGARLPTLRGRMPGE